MSKRKKTNLKSHAPPFEVPRSSIGFGAFKFSKKIAGKYGIFRKQNTLPALIFVRLFVRWAKTKNVMPYPVVSASNYFRFHLSFYLKIIRQLMKTRRDRSQSRQTRSFANYEVETPSANNLWAQYTGQDIGTVNYAAVSVVPGNILKFFRVPGSGIKNKFTMFRQVLQTNDFFSAPNSRSASPVLLSILESTSRLKYLNNQGNAEYGASGALLPSLFYPMTHRTNMILNSRNLSVDCQRRNPSAERASPEHYTSKSKPANNEERFGINQSTFYGDTPVAPGGEVTAFSYLITRAESITVSSPNPAVSRLQTSSDIERHEHYRTFNQYRIQHSTEEGKSPESRHTKIVGGYPGESAAALDLGYNSPIHQNRIGQNIYYRNIPIESGTGFFTLPYLITRQAKITLNHPATISRMQGIPSTDNTSSTHYSEALLPELQPLNKKGLHLNPSPIKMPRRFLMTGKAAPMRGEAASYQQSSPQNVSRGNIPMEEVDGKMSPIEVVQKWKRPEAHADRLSAKPFAVNRINPQYADALSKKMDRADLAGYKTYNSAELVLKKSSIPRTETSTENGENMQAERTASTKMNDDLIKESFFKRPVQDLSIIADRVYKIIEKKISIEKDRRGLL